MDWLVNNKEWFFSGAGIAVITLIFNALKPSRNGKAIKNTVIINNTNSDSIPTTKKNDQTTDSPHPNNHSTKSLEQYKNETRILFIDDDVRFKVAKILVRSGWVHTKLIKDVGALDDAEIIASNILFIDVQGVGVSLGFSDEGLGLALAIKGKYPDKKVVIYSAESQGDRFHAALRQADASLNKNADPYEFQKLVEDFTINQKK